MILSIIVIVAVIAVDLATKSLVAAHIAIGESIGVIPGVVELTHVENSGAAFSMLTENRWVFIVISLAAIAILLGYLFARRPKSAFMRVSLAMIAGGGIANMIERLSPKGTVTDFINPTFVDFAVFNVADSCVTVGCGMLIVWMIADSVREARSKKTESGKAAGEDGDRDD